MVRIHSRSLNKGETLACTRRVLQRALPMELIDWISMAGLGRDFQLEERLWRDPGLTGTVVLSATVSEGGGAHVLLYVVKKSQWLEADALEFEHEMLPLVANWIRAIVAKPPSQRTMHEEAVVELSESGLRFVELRRRSAR